MNRDNWVGRVGTLDKMELVKQAAFHEAGHAAAIYLRNRYLNLPRSSFRISLLGLKQARLVDLEIIPNDGSQWQAKLEGGLLAEALPDAVVYSPWPQSVLSYKQSCEADVVNLLAGPLAEAKHVAQRDGETFNQHLVNYIALKNYGGMSDQEKIEQYLDGFGLSAQARAEKLRELHLASFNFVNQARHWRAISSLAHYILESEKEIILCDEAIEVMENAINASHGFGRCKPLFSRI